MDNNNNFNSEMDSIISEAIIDRSQKEEFIQKLCHKRNNRKKNTVIPIVSIGIAACLAIVISFSTKGTQNESSEKYESQIAVKTATNESKEEDVTKQTCAVPEKQQKDLIAQNTEKKNVQNEDFIIDEKMVFSNQIDSEYEKQWQNILELNKKGLNKETVAMLILFVKQNGKHKEEADSLLKLLDK